MIMPSASTSIFQIRLSRGIWMSMVGLIVGTTAVAFYVVTHHINYFQMLLENQQLRRQISRYESRIEDLRFTQKQVTSLDASLRELLGMKNKTNIVKASAVGGPKATAPIADPISAEEEKIDAKVQRVKEIKDDQLVSFEEIEQFIGELKTVYLATPLGKPIQGGWITSSFGKRDQIFRGDHGDDSEDKEWHAGIDIASAQGAPIYATADGMVGFAGRLQGYGLLVTIQHGITYSTRYGHCSKIAVKNGERVRRGQLIAYVGSTGFSTGPHVHYEVRQNNSAINPMKFIKEEW